MPDRDKHHLHLWGMKLFGDPIGQTGVEWVDGSETLEKVWIEETNIPCVWALMNQMAIFVLCFPPAWVLLKQIP